MDERIIFSDALSLFKKDELNVSARCIHEHFKTLLIQFIDAYGSGEKSDEFCQVMSRPCSLEYIVSAMYRTYTGFFQIRIFNGVNSWQDVYNLSAAGTIYDREVTALRADFSPFENNEVVMTVDEIVDAALKEVDKLFNYEDLVAYAYSALDEFIERLSRVATCLKTDACVFEQTYYLTEKIINSLATPFQVTDKPSAEQYLLQSIGVVYQG